MTAAVDGSPLYDVFVAILTSSGMIKYVYTRADGTYLATGLPASSTGYSVCFDTGGVSHTPPITLERQCYKGVPWSNYGSGPPVPPSGTTPVPVSSGQTALGIDAVLQSP